MVPDGCYDLAEGAFVSDDEDQTTVDPHAHRAQVWVRVHHEAAHAVAGTLLGGRVTGVEVRPGPPVEGRTQVDGLDGASAGPDAGPFRSDGWSTVRRIVYLLAGPVAERIAGGGSALIMNDPAAFVSTTLSFLLDVPAGSDLPPQPPDLVAVADLIVDHFGREDEVGIAAAVDHLGLSVESFVRSQWTNIELVAAALLRDGRLTEEQFHSLLSRMLSEPPPSELLQLLPGSTD